ncbi:MAG: hypothetical protein AAF616_00880 [Bacteroidota bacterium]
MSRSIFQLGQSSWWILLLLLVALGLSYFLYQKKNVPWGKNQNWLLFNLRTVATFLILLLLLDPSITLIQDTEEPPVVLLAIDNSQSVLGRGADSTALKRSIEKLKEDLEEQGLSVRVRSITDGEPLVFDGLETSLSGLLSTADQNIIGENTVGAVLMSDGIFNRGASPLYGNYLSPVFTIGLGDTVPARDVSITRALYNKVSYQGNQTPIRIELSQTGFQDQEFKLILREQEKTIAEKKVKFTRQVHEVEMLISSSKEGLRHLVAEIPPQEGESTLENNRRDIFIEVIDSKQKILLVATAPHPDLKAIRRSLEKTGNYATSLFIPSIHKEFPKEVFDVVIYHGAFSGEEYLPKGNPGVWYIFNRQTAISKASKQLGYLSINRKSAQPDRVTGSFNPDFSKFVIDDPNFFESFPPLEVPFGEYKVSGVSEVLLYQKLGSVVTKKPLMIINEGEGLKSAVLLGQNIWRWKLQEAAINENTAQFDQLVTKTIQFLSVKNDKKQFRFEPRKSKFTNSESPLFDVEVYNEIYERIDGNRIDITLNDENGNERSFQFVNTNANSTFRAPSLAPGLYRYDAKVEIGPSAFREKGEFLVEQVNLEFLDLSANHRLLRNLSAKTEGAYLHYSEIQKLPDLIEERDFKPVLHSEKSEVPLVKSFWYYIIIFLLFSSEWFLRRYWGAY